MTSSHQNQDEAMSICQYLGPSLDLMDPAFKRSLPVYKDALDLYKGGRFGQAMAVFRKVRTEGKNRPI
eukprot:4779885-Pyramimonas_sp.AAC.1